MAVIKLRISARIFQLRNPVFSVRLWISFESEALYSQISDSRKGGKRKNTFMFGVVQLVDTCELADLSGKVGLIW